MIACGSAPYITILAQSEGLSTFAGHSSSRFALRPLRGQEIFVLARDRRLLRF